MFYKQDLNKLLRQNFSNYCFFSSLNNFHYISMQETMPVSENNFARAKLTLEIPNVTIQVFHTTISYSTLKFIVH